MKLTKNKLKKIIAEELDRILPDSMYGHGTIAPGEGFPLIGQKVSPIAPADEFDITRGQRLESPQLAVSDHYRDVVFPMEKQGLEARDVVDLWNAGYHDEALKRGLWQAFLAAMAGVSGGQAAPGAPTAMSGLGIGALWPLMGYLPGSPGSGYRPDWPPYSDDDTADTHITFKKLKKNAEMDKRIEDLIKEELKALVQEKK